MPNLRLSSADRDRLGCSDLLPIALGSITNREAIALQQLGYPTPHAFREALKAKPVDPDDEHSPIATVDYEAWTALVWLGLRRAGIESDLDTLTFDYESLELVVDKPPAQPRESGKDRAPARSTRSARTNSTSGGTSRRKSTTTE